MALKAVMYGVAEGVALTDRDTRAIINGESLGQVSTQTLDNVTALDRIIQTPMLRPLIGLAKDEIVDRARKIGTFELSSRTRELCDIAGGARVSVSTPATKLTAIMTDIGDLVEQAVMANKTMRLTDWVPGL